MGAVPPPRLRHHGSCTDLQGHNARCSNRNQCRNPGAKDRCSGYQGIRGCTGSIELRHEYEPNYTYRYGACRPGRRLVCSL
ncbi:hypothetical protein D3C75_707360 [compost metagenome]